MVDVAEDTLKSLVKARGLELAGQIAEAEAVYAGILRAQPDNTAVWAQFGAFYLNTGHPAQAVALLSKLAEKAPHDTMVNYHLGVAYYHLSEYDRAKFHFETCLEAAPNHAPALRALTELGLNFQRMRQQRTPPSEIVFNKAPIEFSRLQIEVTTWCNLQCAGCPRTIDIEEGKWENIHMPLQHFKRIVDQMPPSDILCLQGVGESTLHPEFPDMVVYAKASGKYKRLTLNTNALARPAEYYRQLKALGLEHISVSVDSFDPAIANDCRKGTKVGKLEERLREIHAIYATQPITVTVVVSKRNLADIPNTLRILDSIGAMHVELQPLIIYDSQKGADGNSLYDLNQQDYRILRSYTLHPYGHLHITLAVSVQNAPMRCMRPFIAPYITASGYLTPCCTIEDPAVLGHIKIEGRPFEAIWQTPSLQAWLRDYATQAPEICKGCCFYTG